MCSPHVPVKKVFLLSFCWFPPFPTSDLRASWCFFFLFYCLFFFFFVIQPVLPSDNVPGNLEHFLFLREIFFCYLTRCGRLRVPFFPFSTPHLPPLTPSPRLMPWTIPPFSFCFPFLNPVPALLLLSSAGVAPARFGSLFPSLEL